MAIMIDFAKKDNRSIAAMLRGNGDGREKKFEDFRNSEVLRDPLITEEEIQEVYEAVSRAEYFRDRVTVAPVKQNWLPNVMRLV